MEVCVMKRSTRDYSLYSKQQRYLSVIATVGVDSTHTLARKKDYR